MPFVTSSYISADGLLSTSVTGNMLVKSNCSLQFVDLTLRNAPASANILFYAGSFPVSSTGMSGEIVNGVSPEIVFYDQSQFVVSSSLPGKPSIKMDQ